MSRAAREISEALILALIVFLVIQGSVRNFKVDGSSMVPNLESGQFLLVNKLVYFKLDTSRLAKLTGSPSTVYSMRTTEPMLPAKTLPVAIPMPPAISSLR